MNERDENEQRKEREDFLKTDLTYGLVIRADIRDIQDLKNHIADKEDLKVVYQTTSPDNLWIKEGEEKR